MNQYNQKIVKDLELPQDILLGVPLLSLQGNKEILIENHRGLLQYDSFEIRVKTKEFVVQILGKELHIQEYRRDILMIEGIIEGVRFIS